MEPRVAQNIIALLTSNQRLTLRPSDIPAYNEAMLVLERLARPQKKTAPEGADNGKGKDGPDDGLPGLTD